MINVTKRPTAWAHQAKELEVCKDLAARCEFWEQRTGKTRLILDNVLHLANAGKIDALLVVTDNGIHRNWITNEVPKHLPGANIDSCFYTSSKAKTKAHKEMLADALDAEFAIVAMSWQGFMTESGTAFAKKFLKKRKVFYVLDESTAIKNPKAIRTKRIVASGRLASYRRILTGTPITKAPFDVYMPVKFVDEMFWTRNGFRTYSAFKNFYGVWENGFNSKTGRTFRHCVRFRNLDHLKNLLKQISSRVVRDDVFDAPANVYTKVYFELTPEQQRTYNMIREDLHTSLDSGEVLDASLAIVNILRRHQVTSNYLPNEDGTFQKLGERNPRLDCLERVCENCGHQAIIWARFTHDIDEIMGLLGDRAVRYDGKINDDDRQRNKEMFVNGDRQFFVSRVDVAAKGHDFSNAGSVIYYNNNFDLELRLQSEDRPLGHSQKHPVGYVDIVAADTVDDKIVASLRAKLNIAKQITGDKIKEWI